MRRWLLTYLFALIVSAFVDPETCPWVWLKTSCGTYPNQAYVFASPAYLWKIMLRLMVGCSDLFASIYCFDWSKISFRFFVQTFFCWLLICVVNRCMSWRCMLLVLSSGFIENFQLVVSKPGIQICFLHSFVEGCGECAVFLWFHPVPSINWLTSRQLLNFEFFYGFLSIDL